MPLLQWPRAMSLDGEPADVVARIDAYDEWLATSADVPSSCSPSNQARTMMGPEIIDWCAVDLRPDRCGRSEAKRRDSRSCLDPMTALLVLSSG